MMQNNINPSLFIRSMNEIARGAEAVLTLDKELHKSRVKKGYRIAEIDIPLRKLRTRKEAKVLEKLYAAGFPVPKLLKVKENTLVMEYLKAPPVKDVLGKSNYKKICSEIGKRVKELHDMAIIHGDLTTSNFILKEGKVFFIDFGLSFQSVKAEDKAVDLHLLRQALESKHYQIWEKAFKEVLRAYGDKEVIKRLEVVEKRGRYKGQH